MTNKNEKALHLIQKATEEDLLLMEGFLTEEKELRALIHSKVDMIIYRINHKVDDEAEKQLKDFCEFFGER